MGNLPLLVESFPRASTLILSGSDFEKAFHDRVAALLCLLDCSGSEENFRQNLCRPPHLLIPAVARASRTSGLFAKFQACGGPSSETTMKQIKISEARILRNSISFRGRFRWSIYYAETLLERLFTDGKLSDRAIDEVAKKTRCILKGPLKTRILQLADMSGKASLLEDVFNMAIDADLFGRSRILSSPDSPELINQALGYVELAESEGTNALKVCLAERLVVDSVLDYLIETGLLERRVNCYLYENQFCAGVLEKPQSLV